MKFKTSVIIIIIIVLAWSCNVDDGNNMKCGILHPIEDLKWLKDIKTRFESELPNSRAQIIQYQYEGDYVFLVDPCHQCPDALASVYNCKGEVICEFGGYLGINSCPEFNNTASDPVILYNGIQD